MVIRPTYTLSGREGGSASALLAGYGRPGMSEGCAQPERRVELARSEPGGAARRPPQHLCVSAEW
eukprot:scaffold31377_cov81-Phaeocystis_antarctica.AAC.2